MTTSSVLMKFVRAQLGNGGSVYQRWAGIPGQPWCDAFISYCLAKTDNGSLYCDGRKEINCPNSINWCYKHLALIPIYLAIEGDVIFYDWEPNGLPNHVGFVDERVSDVCIHAIEGNTSGGKVARRERTDAQEQATFRLHYTPDSFSADKKLVVDGLFGYNSIAVMQRWLKACGYYTGEIDAIMGRQTVKALQSKLGVNADGYWGPKTTKALQRLVGTAQDGSIGPKTVKAFQLYLNANVSFTVTPAKPQAPVTQPVKSGKVYIGQACSDNDKKAGDSSGNEVKKSAFKYSTSSSSCYNWTYVFRPKDAAKAEKAAAMCEKAIANNNIGYSKRGETAYGKDRAMTKLAKAVNYDLSKITVKCGLSCGDLICLCNHYAGLSTCYIGSGLQLANKLKKSSSFECLSYKKGMALKRGDTIITAHSSGKNNHVAMIL